MDFPTAERIEELEGILSDKLAKNYPDWSVECGENWELIAEIFYQAGIEDATRRNAS